MKKPNLSFCLKLLLIPAALLLALSIRFYASNRSFTDFTHQMFLEEVTGNTLNLHYTLENPASYGISEYPVTLGNGDAEAAEASTAVLENYRQALDGISHSALSKKNQLTYDILSSYLDNQASGKDYYLYAEPLGPTIGTQAQLPVLLAEYTFRSKQDVRDYLGLLSQMDTYYASLLEFEQAKADAGLFMSDAVADSIISQCQSFISNPSENFLLTLFEEKIDSFHTLTETEKTDFKKTNQAAVINHVVPAYQLLIDGLTQLKGSGTNTEGLSHLKDGKSYYEYLVRESTGCYDAIEDIESRIQEQMKADFTELRELITDNPSLLSSNASSNLANVKPSDMLSDLQKKISDDFPAPPSVSYEVKYVHKSLQEFLSPAFYLTPPMDNLTQNVIYINQGTSYTPLDLYSTLAHEGYPGHLYQTVYSGSVPSNEVRSLLNFGGYVEGWATYVEMYSFDMADVSPEAAALYRLNRSLMLGISCILDIGIHYHGYSRAETASYLSQMGFTSAATAESFYNSILEAPANYLKYFVGCLNFMDLRDEAKEAWGKDFTLKKFHQEVLEVGPAPFSVLKKYIIGS